MSSKSESSDVRPKESGWFLIIFTITIIGSTIQFGHGLSVIDGIERFLNKFISSILVDRYHISSSAVKETENLVYTGIASIFVLGLMFGSLSAKSITDKFGRRGGLLINNIFIVIGAILQGISKTINSFEIIFVGRFISGFGGGIILPLSIMYLMEISTRKNRGKAAVINQAFISVGITFAQLITFRQILGTCTLWPYSFAITIIPAALSIFGLPLCPESPSWLLMKKRESEAYDALRKLRRNQNIEIEFKEMIEEQEATTCKSISIYEVLTKKEYRIAVSTIIVVFFVQQFSGINMILAFSNNIYSNAGLSSDNIQYAIIGSGIALMASSSIAGPFIDTVGRRKLLIYPLALMILMLILITIALICKVYVLSIVGIYLYMLCFDISLGVIPQSLMVEYFQQDARSSATSIGICVCSISNFIAFWIFKPFMVNEKIKNYVFIIFIILCIMSLIFLKIYTVETVNRKFEDISRDLRGESKVRKVEYKL